MSKNSLWTLFWTLLTKINIRSRRICEVSDVFVVKNERYICHTAYNELLTDHFLGGIIMKTYVKTRRSFQRGDNVEIKRDMYLRQVIGFMC